MVAVLLFLAGALVPCVNTLGNPRIIKIEAYIHDTDNNQQRFFSSIGGISTITQSVRSHLAKASEFLQRLPDGGYTLQLVGDVRSVSKYGITIDSSHIADKSNPLHYNAAFGNGLRRRFDIRDLHSDTLRMLLIKQGPGFYQGAAMEYSLCSPTTSAQIAASVVRWDATGMLVAHEVGHTLGYNHDPTGGYIMSANIAGARFWSQESVNSIMSQNHGCLSRACHDVWAKRKCSVSNCKIIGGNYYDNHRKNCRRTCELCGTEDEKMETEDEKMDLGCTGRTGERRLAECTSRQGNQWLFVIGATILVCCVIVVFGIGCWVIRWRFRNQKANENENDVENPRVAGNDQKADENDVENPRVAGSDQKADTQDSEDPRVEASNENVDKQDTDDLEVEEHI
eukprot:GEMP01032534.1.p1 GENE.GEMP01032534.1~~GEMP01032534.1.p1  ORF type:complete len:397 (+),score=35.65 GEMP01032534.1:110-1300(+)